jgi:hypothetical protein
MTQSRHRFYEETWAAEKQRPRQATLLLDQFDAAGFTTTVPLIVLPCILQWYWNSPCVPPQPIFKPAFATRARYVLEPPQPT